MKEIMALFITAHVHSVVQDTFRKHLEEMRYMY